MSDDHSYNSEQAIKERALEKKRGDADDFYSEVAGRENGKTSRFLSKEERDRRNGKTNDQTAKLSAFDILLMDPEYHAAYDHAMGLLSKAEMETQQAIDEAEVALSIAQDALEDTQDHASTLPDGTRVFRDKDGNVFMEGGKQIHPPETDAIVWKDSSPSYEDYLARQKSASDWRAYLDDLRTYQTDVLGAARNRLSDPDNPPSQEELDKIREEIQSKRPVSKRFEQEVTPEQGMNNSAKATIDIPVI